MDVSDFTFAASKPRTCPVCGSPRVADIVYGMPSPEMHDSPGYGERFVTGGCLADDVSPAWRCRACETSIYPEHACRVLEDLPPPF